MRFRTRIKRTNKLFEKCPLFSLRRVSELKTGIELEYWTGIARLEVFKPGIIRIWLSRNLELGPKISNAVIAQPEGSFQVVRKPDQICLLTDLLKLIIPEGPFRFEIYDHNSKLLSRDFPGLAPGFSQEDFSLHRYIFPGEEFFGLGDKYGSLSRKGRVWTFWNRDVGSRKFERDPRYSSIPFLLSWRPGIFSGWFFDQPGFFQIDLGEKYPGLMTVSGIGKSLDFYFLYANSFKELITLYTDLTGKPFLPPLWSLGYHQSRYSYFSEQEVEEVAEEFLKREIPLSAIHLDIHYMDQYQVFTFDKKNFPHPKELAQKLKEKGIRLVSIIDPGLKVDSSYAPYVRAKNEGYLCPGQKGEEYRRRLWPGQCAFPDFFRKEVQDFWAEEHQGLFENGISGIWNDMNEPSFWKRDLRIGKLVISFCPEREPRMVHQISGEKVSHLECRNLYGQKECEATVLGFKKYKPGIRPFILSRSGFAGIQRLSALWTGDSRSCFLHLAGSITQLLSLGLSGVSFAGADIGGFAGDCDDELYARWIQLGAFYPFCRTHSCIGTRSQEPYQFGAKVERIARTYLQLRYRLLPTFYSLFWESYQRGVPLWRPLFMEFPNDFAVRKIEDQFMVGEFLLLAPVLKRGQKERRIYLPEGRWVDFWNKQEYLGPSWIEQRVSLEQMPIFIRDGAILVFQQKPITKIPWEELELEIYLGTQSQRFVFYEDDGESEEYLQGKFSRRELQLEKTVKGYLFSIGAKTGEFLIPARRVGLKFYGLKSKPQIYSKKQEPEKIEWSAQKNLLRMEIILLDDRDYLWELVNSDEEG